jgi:hypothetical protein
MKLYEVRGSLYSHMTGMSYGKITFGIHWNKAKDNVKIDLKEIHTD